MIGLLPTCFQAKFSHRTPLASCGTEQLLVGCIVRLASCTGLLDFQRIREVVVHIVMCGIWP